MMVYLTVFSRLVIGIAFAISGLAKLRNMRAFVRAVDGFEIIPRRFSSAVAGAIILVELSVATLTWIEHKALLALLLSQILLLVFTSAIISVIMRGDKISCNCFGVSEVPLDGYEVLRNLGFMVWGFIGIFGTFRGFEVPLDILNEGLLLFFAVAFVLFWTHVREFVGIFH